MRSTVLFGTVALLAGSLLAAQAGSKDDIKSAAKKLAEKNNYGWTTIVESPAATAGQFRPGPTEGKTEKDGFTFLAVTRGDTQIEAVLKGGKGALKTPDGWKSLAEAEADTGQNAARFMARTLQTFKAPAAQAEDMVAKVKELKKTDDAYTGELTEEGVKELLTFGRRPDGANITASNVKGSVKFWIQDGVLARYEFKVQGKVNFNGNERDIDRTTTVYIKDVGSTKVDVPEAAKTKLL